MAGNNGFWSGQDRLDEDFDDVGKMTATFEAELARLLAGLEAIDPDEPA